MPFVPPSSLAIVGTVTVTDTLAETLLATIATNTTGVATDATLRRVQIAASDTAINTLAPEVEEFDYTHLLEVLATNTSGLATLAATIAANTAQLATTQPISVASLPLPAGAATEATVKRVERGVDDLFIQVMDNEGDGIDAAS